MSFETEKQIAAKGFLNELKGGSVSPLSAIWAKTNQSIYQHEMGHLAYSVQGKSLVVAGDPWLYEGGDPKKLWSDFQLWAGKEDRCICGYYFLDTSCFISTSSSSSNRFEVFPLGSELSIELACFDLNISSSLEIRRGLRGGERRGLRFMEVGPGQKAEWLDPILKLRKTWLSHHRREIKYLLSSPVIDGAAATKERWFLALKGNDIVAFVGTSPYQEQQNKSIYLDHMISSSKFSKGGMDFLLAKCLLKFQAEAYVYFNMGLCPFQGQSLDLSSGPIKKENEEVNGSDKASLRQGCVTGGLQLLAAVPWLISSRGLYDFKRKFCSRERPAYLLLDSKYSLMRQAKDLLLVTYGN